METISVAAARAIDDEAVRRFKMPSILLMENAARAVADAARELGDAWIILCGPGNNGGDGLAAARHLGAKARVCLLREPDPQKSPDAALQLEILRAAGHEISLGQLPGPLSSGPLSSAPLSSGTVWIDAMFGTGLARGLEGLAAAWVEAFNCGAGPKLCVDVPSGMDGDSGAALGPVCRGDLTVTFAAAKQGLVTAAGAPLAGQIRVAALGIPNP